MDALPGNSVSSIAPATTAEPAAESPSTAEAAEPQGGAVHILVSADETRILLTGEIDADLEGEFSSAVDGVRTNQPRLITLDLQHVHFMDSFGIAFVSRLAGAAPGRVKVVRAPPSVRFLLEVTHTDDLISLDED